MITNPISWVKITLVESWWEISPQKFTLVRIFVPKNFTLVGISQENFTLVDLTRVKFYPTRVKKITLMSTEGCPSRQCELTRQKD